MAIEFKLVFCVPSSVLHSNAQVSFLVNSTGGKNYGQLDGLELGGDRPSIIPHAWGNIIGGRKSDMLGKAVV